MGRVCALLAAVAVFGSPAAAMAGPPTITGFSPATGPAGTIVTISGTGFTGATHVTIGGPSAAFNVLNATTIRAVVPALAGTGPVTVTTPGGTTESRTVFSVDKGIVPSVGSAPPGGRFRLSGSGFPASSSFTIDLDSAVVARGVTNPVGGFQGLGITVPQSETLDSHTLSLVDSTGSSFPISFLIQADWPMARQNVYGTGQNVLESTLNVSTVNTMTQKWSAGASGSLGAAPPAVAGGVLYLGSADGKVVAVDTSTHAKLWTVKPGSSISGSPAVSNGTVYIGDGAQVFALDAATGATRWSVGTAQSPAGVAPIVVNGTLYFGGNNGTGATLWSVDATTGAVNWAKQLSTAVVAGSPAYSSGIVYVGTSDGVLYALDATTGKVDWSRSPGGLIVGTPTVRGGMVFVAAGPKGQSVFAYDATTGVKQWGLPESATASPAYDSGMVFVTTASGVTALRATTGATLWSTSLFPALSLEPDSPAVAHGIVYTDYDGYPIAVIESTGNEIWQAPAQLTNPASPVVVDGQVFVGAGDDKMHVYGP